MENEIVIYVAGNPNAYPLEYYNTQTQSFEGAIPELFRRFSENSEYRIEYYDAGVKDRREHLVDNVQVDIVSGYKSGDVRPLQPTYLDLAAFVQNGEQMTCQIGFTDAAPEKFVREFKTFAENISAETFCGVVIDTAQQPMEQTYTPYVVTGAVLAIAVMLAVLLSKLKKRKKQIEELDRAIDKDPVTGIGSRRYLHKMFFTKISGANRMLYNFVYFKIGTTPHFRTEENDEIKRIIQHSAEVLKSAVAQTDILARVSENGFVVIRYAENQNSAAQWVEDTLFRIRGISAQHRAVISVNATAGIYPLGSSTSDVEKIILYTSECAQLAEQQDMDYIECTPERLERFVEEQQLKLDSFMAMERQEFQIYLHFLVDAKTHEIIGAEALSRWHHPQRGILGPGQYIPVMEREGSIDVLDYYNLEKVCRLMQRLKENKIETFTISCNFSRCTFGKPGFAAKCKAIIDQYDFPRQRLVLELTESISEPAREQVQKNILELRKYGVGIALDDLGNGFASVYDLRDYTVTGLKIPMELTKGVHSSGISRIISTVVDLGHELGVTVLAEGVENDEELHALQALGCDAIQGFRFYVPMPEFEAERIIEKEFRDKK